jgi:hypothetical protein
MTVPSWWWSESEPETETGAVAVGIGGGEGLGDFDSRRSLGAGERQRLGRRGLGTSFWASMGRGNKAWSA